MKLRRTIFALALSIATLSCPTTAILAGDHPTVRSLTSTVTESKLKDGLYLVVRDSANRKDLEPVKKPERLLVNDYHFLDPAERQETEYVVINAEQFVPMILHSDPEKKTDARGKPMLHLQLAEDEVGPLEEFTQKNTGGRLAIVIGGEIVTVHKIREAVKGGKLQITRCTDHGCEAIYTELQHKQHDEHTD